MPRTSRARGSRAGLSKSAPRVARMHRGSAARTSTRLGGTARFAAAYGPGTPSIKKRNTYDALRRKGYSKEKAARIANAQANGTISRGRGPSTKR